MVIYVAGFITLLSLIICFSVILNPTANMIVAEFSALFVAEWGIQIIGASQACSALELVFLMQAISSTD